MTLKKALFCLTVGVICGTLSHLVTKAWPHDYGQWENVDPVVRGWYASLVQPDTLVSCCGESDAYEADEVAVFPDGKVVAVVTDERDDAPLKRAHVPRGTRYVVPPNKVVDATKQRGNPTGHTIIFLGTIYAGDPYTRQVLCYVMGSGT